MDHVFELFDIGRNVATKTRIKFFRLMWRVVAGRSRIQKGFGLKMFEIFASQSDYVKAHDNRASFALDFTVSITAGPLNKNKAAMIKISPKMIAIIRVILNPKSRVPAAFIAPPTIPPPVEPELVVDPGAGGFASDGVLKPLSKRVENALNSESKPGEMELRSSTLIQGTGLNVACKGRDSVIARLRR